MTKSNNKNDILNMGTLCKSGQSYTVKLLDADCLDEIMGLQQKIIDSLPDDQKSFILPKSKTFFENHFKRGANTMIGIYCEGELIAQSIVLNPNAAHPETGMVDMERVDAPETLSIIEGVLVDPAYRGNRLMEEMVGHWIDYAEQIGRKHVIAEIAIDNPYSWGVFLDKGLTLHSTGTDPDDGTALYNAHESIANIRSKQLSGVFNHYAEKKICDADDLKAQQKLLDKGFKGVAYDRKTKKLTMAK
tara:strand:+ start:2577 stop:3314 length:738 start_codon:yes stop_codon:yes gene_type:complete